MYRQQPLFSHEHRSVEILVSHHHQPLEMASNTSPGLSALLIGATGATGRLVLRHLLRSDEFSRIGEYGRRVTDRAELIAEEYEESSMSKLHQKVIDFETLTDGEWAEESWNVVYITLGTSKAIAGSHEQFVKIDREYVLRAAKAARSPNVTSQKIVYLSSSGASATSWIPYLQ
ncbi:Protein fmp52, mitochondrial [Tulasnella sp. 419]|nr:Protein fmp52, mitochondrial [Tulasnella sp. 419]